MRTRKRTKVEGWKRGKKKRHGLLPRYNITTLFGILLGVNYSPQISLYNFFQIPSFPVLSAIFTALRDQGVVSVSAGAAV